MILDIRPETEALLTTAAQQQGIDIETFIERAAQEAVQEAVQEQRPPSEKKTVPEISAKNAAAIAMLKQWIADDVTNDPEKARKADAEVDELMQNLNKNRIESGERPLFP